MRQNPALRMLVTAIALAVAATACTSTRIVNQWANPGYVPPRFERILVVGISRQSSVRRAFEDAFVARLRATGVDAVPSYRHVPEDGPVPEDRLQAAVQQAGADAAIITRLVRVETRTEVSPGFYQPAPAFMTGFYGGYSAAWLGYYEPPRIRQYEVYISETSLYDMRTSQLAWTATVQTTAPRDIGDEIERYVKTVVDALERSKLLAGAAHQDTWSAPGTITRS